MAFVIQDTQLPARFTAQPMSDVEFAEFCAEHPDLDFEMSAEGEMIIMAPAFSLTSARNLRIAGQLYSWSNQDGRGIALDSSGGFVLPNGARRSPDASWTLKSRINSLSTQQRASFWPLCPDFIIELRSETDRLKPLQRKMQEYLSNGAQLGWLIDPTNRSVEIYRPNQDPETRMELEHVDGEGPVAGFCLELNAIWNPLGD